MSKTFIDTNILVYCLDNHEPEKQNRARDLLKKVALDLSGVISTQVMQEFYVTATVKLGADPLIAKDILRSFNNIETVTIMPDIIKSAIDCSILNKISFWDALIVSAAESAGCGTLWTEDLNNGQVIRGIKIENPLIP